MSGASPGSLKTIPLILVLLTAVACPTFAEDIQTLILKAESGNPEAQYELGVAYHDGNGVPQDNAGAAKWFREAVEQGNAKAELELAHLYFSGKGVQKNHVEGARLLRKAADQGLSEAQFYLGVVYISGEGVQKDVSEAARWYRKAADQGFANAAFRLAILYQDGKGVPQDFLLSYFWFSIFTSRCNEIAYTGGVIFRNFAPEIQPNSSRTI